MNVAVTRAAEGFPRRAFTVEDIRRMIDAGVIGEDERFELIEGEIVPMSPKHDPHERIKVAFAIAISRRLPDDLWLGIEGTIYLAERTFVEPDLCIFRRELKIQEVKGADLLLVVEVADSSLAFDIGTKARLYASYGARELWVVNAQSLVTAVHTGPTANGWTSVREVGPTDFLQLAAVPGFTFRLADVD